MHINSITHKDTPAHLKGLRVQLDRIIKVCFNWNEIGISINSTAPFLMDKISTSRNWFGAMIKAMGETLEPDRWTANIETHEDEKKMFGSVKAELDGIVDGCKHTAYAIEQNKNVDAQTFQTGYLRAIFYLLEASMWIENKMMEGVN